MSDQEGTVGRLATSGVLILLGFSLSSGLTFVLSIVLARTLGPDQYGLLEIGRIYFLFVSTLTLVGLHNGVSRYLSRTEVIPEQRDLFLSGLHVVVVFSVAASTVTYVFAGDIASDLLRVPASKPVLQVFAVAIPFAALLNLGTGVVRGLEQTRPKVLFRDITLPVLLIAFVVGLRYLSVQPAGYAIAFVLAFFFASAGSVLYVVRQISVRRIIPAQSFHRELLTFSLPIGISGIMNATLSRIDVFLLGFLTASSGGIGVYRAVYPLARFLIVVLEAFNYLIMPMISRLSEQDRMDEIARLYRMVTNWAAALGGPLVFYLLFDPESAVQIAFGAEYLRGARSLQVLAVGFYVAVITGPNSNTLVSLGETKLLAATNALAVVFNIGLNVVLIPEYGILGAAVATTLSLAAVNGLQIAYLYTRLDLNPFSWRLLTVCLGAAGFYVLGGRLAQELLPNSRFAAFLGLLLSLGPYLVLVYRYVLGSDEYERLHTLIAEVFPGSQRFLSVLKRIER
jgi:O-antigen/teichoic acid export membrane protein